jgi:hypothetical protein
MREKWTLLDSEAGVVGREKRQRRAKGFNFDLKKKKKKKVLRAALSSPAAAAARQTTSSTRSALGIFFSTPIWI